MIERLTNRNESGIAYAKIPTNPSNMINVGECYTGRIIDRIAAYEDTGLTPKQVEAQQQEIDRLEVQVEADKDLIRELNNSYINSELNLSALISDKDEQAGRLMLLNDGIKQVIKWLTPHPSDGSRAVEKARLHLITLIGGKEDAGKK